MLMTILLGIILLIGSSESKQGKFNEKEIVNGFNVLRREDQEEEKRAIAYELIIDKDLTEIAKSLKWSDDTWKKPKEHGKFRWTIGISTDPIEHFRRETKDMYYLYDNGFHSNFSVIFNDEYSVHPLEHLFPKQQYVGCAPKNDLEKPFDFICLFQPDITYIDGWGQGNTTAGSGCSGEYENDEGLCVLKKPPKPVVIPTTPPPASPTPEPKETTPPPVVPTTITVLTIRPTSDQRDKTTTMSEVNKLIAKWRETETDGDDYDEDDRTTTEDSSSNSIKIVLAMLFVLASVM